jgi:hypothetical protein
VAEPFDAYLRCLWCCIVKVSEVIFGRLFMPCGRVLRRKLRPRWKHNDERGKRERKWEGVMGGSQISNGRKTEFKMGIKYLKWSYGVEIVFGADN